MPLIKPRKGASKATKRKAASANISKDTPKGQKATPQVIARSLRAAGLSRKRTTTKHKRKK